MRRFLILFLFLLLVFPAFGESSPLPPETPAPARSHSGQFTTPEPPPVINAAAEPELAGSLRFLLDAEYFHVWFPNIANADEAVLIFGDEVWLIDCGDENAAIRGVELMKKLGVKKIDVLVNSHPHDDHLGGLRYTTEFITVDKLLICFPEDVNKTMKYAMKRAKQLAIPVESCSDGDVLTMGGGKVSLRFMLPDDPMLDMNNLSAQTLVQYGKRRILFTADIKTDGEAVLLKQHAADELRADILKMPHHGKDILLPDFCDAVSPSLAVITNTTVDWTGIKYLKNHSIPVMFTNTDGCYCHLYTDGNVWIAEYVPVSLLGKE